MVDANLRHRLSQDVRRLVTGRMTNDDFDDAYYEFYADSADLAVREISGSCWALYSSDALFPYRLRDWHAVDSETRKGAARAVLFLQTVNEYKYPATPDSPADAVIGCALFNVPLVGIAFMIIGLFSLGGGDPRVSVDCLLIGLGIVALCVLVAWGHSKSFDSFRAECDEIGNAAFWPFVDAASLAEANENNSLFSKVNIKIAI